MKTTVHVCISGRVQGVWFRASTKQKAEALGLTGWVKNSKDNSVEAVFEGDEEKVEEMITWCHQGPALAEVHEVKIAKQSKPQHFTTFSIQHS